MLSFFISIVAEFLPMFDFALWYYFALCFVAAVPCILKMLLRR